MSDVVHGTKDGYNNHGCRCDPCRAAWSEYQASRRTPCPDCGKPIHSRGRTDRKCHSCTHKTPITHGKATSYDKRGCRCDACRAAASEARRGRRRRAAQ